MSKSAPAVTAGTRSPAGSILVAALAFVLAGCATNHPMMPTPVLYTGENARPLFTDSSLSRRPSLDLLSSPLRDKCAHALLEIGQRHRSTSGIAVHDRRGA